MKKENLKIELKKIPISNEYNPTLTHSSRSGKNDSYYYLRESQKLSEFIKKYYMKYKKYPETNLNFYKYGRLIGQGAFGKVNLGLNILTGRIVAIKSFNKSNLNSNSENSHEKYGTAISNFEAKCKNYNMLKLYIITKRL